MVIGCLCCRRHKTVLAAGSLQAQTQSVCGMEIFYERVSQTTGDLQTF